MTGMDHFQLSKLLHYSNKDKLACLKMIVLVLDVVRQFALDEASNHVYLRRLSMMIMISVITCFPL